MGLLFKRKLSGKGTNFNKRIADSAISNKYIKEVARQSSSKFALGKSGAKERFQKELIQAQHGGLELKEVHEIVQKGIASGDISKEKARALATDLGLTEERFRKFKDMSEYRDMQKKQERKKRIKKEEYQLITSKRKQESIPQNMPKRTISQKSHIVFTPSMNKFSSNAQISPQNERKSKNIWEILNKKRHPEGFSDNQKEAV